MRKESAVVASRERDSITAKIFEILCECLHSDDQKLLGTKYMENGEYSLSRKEEVHPYGWQTIMLVKYPETLLVNIKLSDKKSLPALLGLPINEAKTPLSHNDDTYSRALRISFPEETYYMLAFKTPLTLEVFGEQMGKYGTRGKSGAYRLISMEK